MKLFNEASFLSHYFENLKFNKWQFCHFKLFKNFSMLIIKNNNNHLIF